MKGNSIDNNSQKERKKKKQLWWLFLLFLLLLVGFLAYFIFFKKNKIVKFEIDIFKNDTVTVFDTASDLINKTSFVDTTIVLIPKKDVVKYIKKIAKLEPKTDTLKTDDNLLLEDTTDNIKDEKVEVDPCQKDTIAPWVYLNPTGGLYYSKQEVKLISDDPTATVEWKIDGVTEWRIYSGRVINVDKNITISYRAVDSCQNRMSPKSKTYEIKKTQEADKCPDDMSLIKVGSKKFCIDKYEWPNKKGYRPSAMVSLYQAQDSCFMVEKRLCKTDEWSIACSGAHKWNYAYGVKYEPQACVTRDTVVQKSGSRSECRGYFEVFDMSGNLAEWTDTKSDKNSDFYNVMGGFWQSGSQSTCFKPRYSYYPQNPHNPVGFRCCKDSEE